MNGRAKSDDAARRTATSKVREKRERANEEDRVFCGSTLCSTFQSASHGFSVSSNAPESITTTTTTVKGKVKEKGASSTAAAVVVLPVLSSLSEVPVFSSCLLSLFSLFTVLSPSNFFNFLHLLLATSLNKTGRHLPCSETQVFAVERLRAVFHFFAPHQLINRSITQCVSSTHCKQHPAHTKVAQALGHWVH